MLKKLLFRPRSYVSRNFWIRNFFFANSASVHTYPVRPAYESVRQTGNFLIRYESAIAWTLIPDMFLSSDVTTSSPVLYHEYSRRCRARWVIASTLHGLQFQVITCGLLNLAMITQLRLQLCQTAARHFEASFQVGRTNLDTVNKLKRAK